MRLIKVAILSWGIGFGSLLLAVITSASPSVSAVFFGLMIGALSTALASAMLSVWMDL